MFDPTWLIAAAIGVSVFVALAMFLGRNSEDMVTRQRREAMRIARSHAPAPQMDEVEMVPRNLPSDEEALFAMPDIRDALERGRKIAAIRLLRERTGMELKQAKQLVDRYPRSRNRKY